MGPIRKVGEKTGDGVGKDVARAAAERSGLVHSLKGQRNARFADGASAGLLLRYLITRHIVDPENWTTS